MRNTSNTSNTSTSTELESGTLSIYNDKKARKNNNINLGHTPRGAEAINYSEVKGKYFWETQDKEATGYCISIKTITKGN